MFLYILSTNVSIYCVDQMDDETTDLISLNLYYTNGTAMKWVRHDSAILTSPKAVLCQL
jgi:hypothetical protein